MSSRDAAIRALLLWNEQDHQRLSAWENFLRRVGDRVRAFGVRPSKSFVSPDYPDTGDLVDTLAMLYEDVPRSDFYDIVASEALSLSDMTIEQEVYDLPFIGKGSITMGSSGQLLKVSQCVFVDRRIETRGRTDYLDCSFLRASLFAGPAMMDACSLDACEISGQYEFDECVLKSCTSEAFAKIRCKDTEVHSLVLRDAEQFVAKDCTVVTCSIFAEDGIDIARSSIGKASIASPNTRILDSTFDHLDDSSDDVYVARTNGRKYEFRGKHIYFENCDIRTLRVEADMITLRNCSVEGFYHIRGIVIVPAGEAPDGWVIGHNNIANRVG